METDCSVAERGWIVRWNESTYRGKTPHFQDIISKKKKKKTEEDAAQNDRKKRRRNTSRISTGGAEFEWSMPDSTGGEIDERTLLNVEWPEPGVPKT